MPHVVSQCTAYFCLNHTGNGVLIVFKTCMTLWHPAIACLLQGHTALHRAAVAGHVAVAETLLLSGVDLEAEDQDVSCGSLYSGSLYTFAIYRQLPFQSKRSFLVFLVGLDCSMSAQACWKLGHGSQHDSKGCTNTGLDTPTLCTGELQSRLCQVLVGPWCRYTCTDAPGKILLLAFFITQIWNMARPVSCGH